MSSSGSALNTVKTTFPHIRRAPGKIGPSRNGGSTHAQRALTPVQMHQAKITNNHARPAAAASGKVVTQSEKGLRPMQENRAEKPQSGKRQAANTSAFAQRSLVGSRCGMDIAHL